MPEDHNNELDPEIAALLGEVDVPGVHEEEDDRDEPQNAPASKEQLTEITGSEHFKNVIDGVKTDITEILIRTKALYEDPPDKKDKFTYREKLTTAYWNLIGFLAPKTVTGIDTNKLMCFRYGLLDTNWLDDTQMNIIRSIPLSEKSSESIYYMDEWFLNIGKDKIRPSVLDETMFIKKRGEKNDEKLNKKQGQFDAELQLTKTRQKEVENIVMLIDNAFEQIKERPDWGMFPELHLKEPLNEIQKDALSTMIEAVKDWQKIDKKLDISFQNLVGFADEISELKEQLAENGDNNNNVEAGVIHNELICVKQMFKMCVGRRGNHFPILEKDYFMPDEKQVATKENVLKILKDVEYLDAGLFRRTHKGVENRIFPMVILLPSYGEDGICWEPFDRHNRAASKSRLAIPMYSKNLKDTILRALADLRWQIAKERAQHYWMEEGLTGHYYEYYTEPELKGDIKSFFIDDYILWITKESQGIQKLDKRVRNAFWRYMPFPQAVKEDLKTRGFAYLDLYKKDENIAMSDGY